MKHSIISNRKFYIITSILFVLFILSLMLGKFPLSINDLMNGEPLALNVFFNLRIPRTLAALIAGFGLGCCGLVFQIIFTNPLASPDMIGVSSSASAGAAFAILFLGNTSTTITICAFIGSLLAVFLTLGLSSLSSFKNTSGLILSGVAIHSISQTIVMLLKLIADPEKELASIEYWMMGGLNAITIDQLPMLIAIVGICIILLIILYKQVLLLSMNEDEASLLGVEVKKMRMLILVIAALAVAKIISVTGLISFVSLLAPHLARRFEKNDKLSLLISSGCVGSGLMLFADILARIVVPSELPISIFTSLLGAPFLIYFLLKNKRN